MVYICKGKINGRSLNKIFKLYLRYHDLEGLRTSLDYFESLPKKSLL
jgi:hypothetical protein